MRLASVGTRLALLFSLAACAPANVSPTQFLAPISPTLSWTGSWVQGPQIPAIIFQRVGQVATLTITAASGTTPPFTLTSGSCVTLSASSTSSNVAITAASSGSCTITITNANPAAGTFFSADVP